MSSFVSFIPFEVEDWLVETVNLGAFSAWQGPSVMVVVVSPDILQCLFPKGRRGTRVEGELLSVAFSPFLHSSF